MPIKEALDKMEKKFDEIRSKVTDETKLKNLDKKQNFYRIGLKRIDKIVITLRTFSNFSKGGAYYYTEEDINSIFKRFEDELIIQKEALMKKAKKEEY